jgi:hypothetical protein
MEEYATVKYEMDLWYRKRYECLICEATCISYDSTHIYGPLETQVAGSVPSEL